MQSQAQTLLPRYPHRGVRALSTVAHRLGVGVLMMLITAALLTALYDIGQQLTQSNRASKVSDLIVTFGTYLVIVIIGIAIWLSRALSLRGTLASIPKAYLPTAQDDVPKAAFELISNEFDRASVIAHISQPNGRTQDGWGRPGTAHENVHFRQAILSTIGVLQSVLDPLYPPPPLNPRASPLSPLAPLLARAPSPVPDALVPLAELYEGYLTKAKYGRQEPTEDEWDSCVKLVAVFIGVLGGAAAGPIASRRRVFGGRLPSSGAGWVLAAGLGVGTGAVFSQRTFTTSVLQCEEVKDAPAKKSLFDLPELPGLPSFSSLSMKVNTDLTASLSNLSSSLAAFRASLVAFQDEVSLGPNSTYSKVIAARGDTSIHPEMGWDATVRLGTELGTAERAFMRARKRAMVPAFARLMGVSEDEVDPRDIPIVTVAGSGGGYRAMVNTLGNVKGMKETGVWDVVSYVSAVSGSCWAINLLYSIGEGQIEQTIQHVKSRIVTPFLDPSTIDILTNKDTKEHLLSGLFLKASSTGGETSLVDVYGTLVASRLFVPADVRTLDPLQLKVSSQRRFTDDGSNPLPIYCSIRHEIPDLAELETASKAGRDAKTAKLRKEGTESKERLMLKSSYMWFELTPLEFGSDELGAWIPTFALGRAFDNGVNVDRQPELSLTILSGIFASAFCATLYSYYKEVKPLLSTLPYFSPIDSWLLSNYETSLDAIHPITPAEIPSFVRNLKGLRPGVPKQITSLETLGLMDAGANLNLPYVPLFRRSPDLIVALDGSADSHELWFTRAEEYALAREMKTWPRVQSKTLFDKSEEAAATVDEAKAQEGEATPEGHPPLAKVELNPNPAPVGSAPTSVQSQSSSDGQSKMPQSQPGEPPLGRCNIWIGSTTDEDTTCRNDYPTVEDVAKRDGIALAYFPLMGGPELEDPGEVWGTWKFDHTEEETDALISLSQANFKSGQQQLNTLIRGIWLRKRRDRLAAQAGTQVEDPSFL